MKTDDGLLTGSLLLLEGHVFLVVVLLHFLRVLEGLELAAWIEVSVSVPEIRKTRRTDLHEIGHP